jgi:hypothetical protein
VRRARFGDGGGEKRKIFLALRVIGKRRGGKRRDRAAEHRPSRQRCSFAVED